MKKNKKIWMTRYADDLQGHRTPKYSVRTPYVHDFGLLVKSVTGLRLGYTTSPRMVSRYKRKLVSEAEAEAVPTVVRGNPA